MKLREILAQAVREIAEEENIPEEKVWEIVPKVRERMRF